MLAECMNVHTYVGHCVTVEAELVSLTGIREHSMTQHDTEESTGNRPTEGCRVM